MVTASGEVGGYVWPLNICVASDISAQPARAISARSPAATCFIAARRPQPPARDHRRLMRHDARRASEWAALLAVTVQHLAFRLIEPAAPETRWESATAPE